MLLSSLSYESPICEAHAGNLQAVNVVTRWNILYAVLDILMRSRHLSHQELSAWYLVILTCKYPGRDPLVQLLTPPLPPPSYAEIRCLKASAAALGLGTREAPEGPEAVPAR